MTKKQKKNLIRILVTAAMMIALHFLPEENAPVQGWTWIRFLLYLIPYLLIGHDVLKKAFKGIVNRQPFDESLLMTIATVGAIALALWSSGDYTEAIAVMLFYQIGEWFQSYAVGKSRRNITELMDIRPDYANIEGEDGQLIKVDPDEVEVGSVIVVKSGEKIPIDGVVVDGVSSLNTSDLTGESVPRTVRPGDEVISGCVNQTGLLKIETTKEFGDSTVSKILDLVENASSRKSKAENFISRFARVYTPAVVYSALALAFLPPLFRLAFFHQPALWGDWIYRALTFLVISCPCALVVSIPLSFFGGIGGASREGILVKGSNYLEALADTGIVAFDKTGTLTKGVFEVSAVHSHGDGYCTCTFRGNGSIHAENDLVDGVDVKAAEERLLHMAAHAERYSIHPIAQSLRAAYPQEADECTVENVEEDSGRGVHATVDGHDVYVGNPMLMEQAGVEWHPCDREGTVIHVAIDGEYAGHIVISDVDKADAKEAVEALKKAGVEKTVLLTGDSEQVAQAVGKRLGIDTIFGNLLPQDKVAKVEELLKQKKKGKILAFVGDGVNDAPVLSRADIGIAMGAMGSDAAIEAADVVLMDDDPLKIAKAISISRKCMRIVKENIWFAIGVKVVCLLLGALGLAGMWAAIFADVGVMILAVLNAIRALLT